ncbi:MAG: PQQ-like beta-propeller repeat protein [Bacteroidota bacterium]|nr:PQQ-like beta-propeller repeat protein [Bacteroidota bacterium]
MKKTAPTNLTTLKQLFILLLFLFPLITAAQVAQWRGPNRNGIYPDQGLAESWPATGPECILTVDGLGAGWSSPVTDGKAIYVTGRKDTLDYLASVDYTGKINWQVPYGKSWTRSYPDSRCTPTLDDNRVYVISGFGKLTCFDATTGKEIWRVEVDKEFDSKYDSYGVAEAPLIVDDKVICSPIGTKSAVVAFDKNTGKLVWQSKSIPDKRGLASPIIFQYKTFRYILTQSSEDLLAVNPDNGDIVWTYKTYRKEMEKGFGGRTAPVTPTFKDDEIFLTKGYDYPSVMLKLAPDGKSVSEKWTNTTLDNHHGGVVLLDGYIYGSNWISNTQGNWVCLKWDTGEVMYEQPWINKGSIISADNKLFCYEEKSGTVALVQPNPKKFEVVSSFKVDKGNGMYWAHPMINDGKLFIRHGSALMVYNIKK